MKGSASSAAAHLSHAKSPGERRPKKDEPWLFDDDVRRHGEEYLEMRLLGHDDLDRELMKIAYQSMNAKVPEGWKQEVTDEGRRYYWHENWPKGRTTLEHPSNEQFSALMRKTRSRLKRQARDAQRQAKEIAKSDKGSSERGGEVHTKKKKKDKKKEKLGR